MTSGWRTSSILGYDTVWLEYEDGRLERGPQVADSDQELIDFLVFLASRSEVNARQFSEARTSPAPAAGRGLPAGGHRVGDPAAVGRDSPAPYEGGDSGGSGCPRITEQGGGELPGRGGAGTPLDRGCRSAGRRQDDDGARVVRRDPAERVDRHVRDRVRTSSSRDARAAPDRPRLGGSPGWRVAGQRSAGRRVHDRRRSVRLVSLQPDAPDRRRGSRQGGADDDRGDAVGDGVVVHDARGIGRGRASASW